MAERKTSDLRQEKAGRVIRKTGDWRIHGHSHPHYELLYVITGSQHINYQGKDYTAREHDLIIYEPRHEHVEWSASEVFEVYVVRFSKSDVRKCSLPFPKIDGPLLPMGDQHEDMMFLLDRYCGEFYQPGSNHEALMTAYLTQLTVMCDRQINGYEMPRWSGIADEPRARLYKVLESIHNSVGSHMDLNDLALTANLSVSHFSRLFKDEFGESPKHYLIRQRMEKAKDLLKNTTQSAQSIAKELGYDNIYFFYRQFKQHTGMTSSEFRDSKKK